MEFGLYDSDTGTSSWPMMINSNSRVGIGTYSPDTPLHVYSDGATSGGQILKLTDTNGSCWLELESDGNGTTQEWGIVSQPSAQGSGSLEFYKRVGTGSGNYRMSITGNGDVGIGTRTPITTLDIRKSGGARLRLENSNTSHNYAQQDESIEFCTDYATAGFIHQKGENLRIGVTGGSSSIKFYTYSTTSSGYSAASSGTQTQSIFDGTYTSSNDIPRMIIASNGRVGIGTSSPETTLDVRGDIKVTEGISFRTGSSYNGTNNNSSIHDYGSQDGLQFNGYRGLIFTTDNGSERMRITQSGNVGIRETSPLAPLHITVDNNTDRTLEQMLRLERRTGDLTQSTSTLGEGGYIGMWLYDDSPSYGIRYEAARIAFRLDLDGREDSGRLIFGTANQGTINDRMTITHLGDVGIGITEPKARLHIANQSSQSDGNVGLRCEGTIRTYAYDADVHVRSEITGNGSGGRLQLYNSWNPNESLQVRISGIYTENSYINNSGNFGINTTNPQARLQVYQTTNSKWAAYFNTESDTRVYIAYDGGHHGMYINTPQTSSSSVYVLRCYGSAGEMLSVKGNGYVGIGTASPSYPLYITGYRNSVSYTAYMNSYGTSTNNGSNKMCVFGDYGIATDYAFYITSDRRIKKNIVDVPDNLALQQVRNIPCRYYEYKDDVKRGPGKTIGFIAQEVKEILPMAVSLERNFIPDEVRLLENISWEEIIDGSNNVYKLTSDLQDVSGVKYKFYVSNDPSGNDEIVKEVVGNADNTFTFEEHYRNVFCYGKEVDDFHVIDKQKLFALNFSATQEIDRIQQQEKTKLEEAQAKITILETELNASNTKIQSLESQVQSLTALISELTNRINNAGI